MLVLGGGSRFPDSPSAIIVVDESWEKMRMCYWRRADNKIKVQGGGSQNCMLILLHESPHGTRSRVRPL
jgi:hypothetical protein